MSPIPLGILAASLARITNAGPAVFLNSGSTSMVYSGEEPSPVDMSTWGLQPNDMVIVGIAIGDSTAETETMPASPDYIELFPRISSSDTNDVSFQVSYKFMGDSPDTEVLFLGTGDSTSTVSAIVLAFRNTSVLAVSTRSIVNTGQVVFNDVSDSFSFSVGNTFLAIGASGHSDNYNTSNSGYFLPADYDTMYQDVQLTENNYPGLVKVAGDNNSYGSSIGAWPYGNLAFSDVEVFSPNYTPPVWQLIDDYGSYSNSSAFSSASAIIVLA